MTARRLLDAARAESRPAPVVPLWRRTRARVAVGLAAAAVVAPLASNDEPSPPQTATLHQTVSSPLSATVALTPTDWSTRIDMTCTDAEWWGGSDERRAYGPYVIDRDGLEHQVSTQVAGPGETARTTGSIDLAVDKLRSAARAGDSFGQAA